MSTPTENSPEPSECDLLLDYAYGELDAPRAVEFERHVESCAKCRTELDMMKRLRTAVRAALPLVEPPAAVTGALHAQLLHAAAQRKPAERGGGGKVLAFTRRVLRHPGYAAAAGLLIVGGALGLQWSRGHLLMAPRAVAPMVEEKDQDEKVATPAPAGVVKPIDAPESGALDKTVILDGEKQKKLIADYQAPAKNEPDIYLRTREGAAPLKVAHASPAPAPSPSKDKSADSRRALADDFNANFGAPSTSTAGPGQGLGSSTDGHVSSRAAPVGGTSNSLGAAATKGGRGDSLRDETPAVKAKAPAEMEAPAPAPPPARVAAAEKRSAANAERGGYAAAPPPAAASAPAVQPSTQAPPQPIATTAPAQTNAPVGEALQQRAEQKPPEAKAEPRKEESVNNLARTADTLRRKAEELANSGRCDEAVKLYTELERQYPTYTVAPRDRLPYVRCLRQTGQEQLANELMNSLKDDNNNSPRMQGQVLDETNLPRATAHRAAKKAAKPAAAPSKASPAAVDLKVKLDR